MRQGLTLVLLAAAVSACGYTRPDSWLLDSSRWERETAEGKFSFLLPPSLVSQDVRGLDSHVGRYQNWRVILSYDYGQWSNHLRQGGERDYTSRPVVVDGKPGMLVRFDLPRHDADHAEGMRYFAGLHVPAVVRARREGKVQYGGDTSLTFTSTCRVEADCDAMEAVLLSVEFSK